MYITIAGIYIYQSRLKREYRVAEIKGKTYYGFSRYPEITNNEYCVKSLPSCNTYGYLTFYKIRPYEYGNRQEKYVKETLAGLLFNNYDTIESYGELSAVFECWVMAWQDNEIILKNNYRAILEEFESEFWINSKPSKEELLSIAKAEPIKHWYPLEVELIQDSKEKRRTKVRIQNQVRFDEYRSNFEGEAEEYMARTLGVLPTAKYQSESTGYSLNIVYTHGRGYFTGNQVYELIQSIRSLFPKIKQRELKDELLKYDVKASMPSIKRHWRPVEVPSDAEVSL